MLLQDKLLSSGVAPGLAMALGDSVDSLTATGTTQTDAYEIRNAISRFTTVASGAGAKLWRSAQPGDELLIYNSGSNALLVYPELGGAIDSNSTNASVVIPAGTRASFVRHKSTLWSMQSENAVDLIFVPAGTGASSRTVQAKLREEMISVKDYGAVGDGVTDDRTAVSNAVTAANGRKILFPNGTYLMNSAFAFAETGRLYLEAGATFSGTSPTGGLREYELAQPTATAGSVMKIERLFENNTFRLQGRGVVWPGKTETYFGVSKEFLSTAGQASSPSFAFTTYAISSSCPGDVVALGAIALARTDNAIVYGGNLVVLANPAVVSPKMVGLEIDIEPSAGVTPAAGSGGLFFNVFNSACPGPAIQINGVSSGTWANGIAMSGIASNGSGFFGNGGSMDTLINGGSTTYTTAVINLGADGRIKFPATQNPSTDANTLDDYEEGTYTPVLTFATPGDVAVTYGTQVGTYRKIGGVVHVQYNVSATVFTFTTASGNLQITGLPFTSISTTGSATRGKVVWSGITKANYTEVGSGIGAGAALFTFAASGSAQAASNVSATDTPSGGTPSFIGVHTYFAA